MNMEISRRSFFAGALSLMALPLTKTFAIPRIYGDGIRDDSDGLQAAFNGEPFIAEDNSIRDALDNGTVVLQNGLFRIEKTIYLGNNNRHFEISKSTFILNGNLTRIVIREKHVDPQIVSRRFIGNHNVSLPATPSDHKFLVSHLQGA
jgi:hypothetical protein